MEESIFDELDKKEIAPQNFSYGIFLCLIHVCYSYLTCFIRENKTLGFIGYVIGILYLYFFAKYLRNFNYRKSVFWVNCQISVLIVSFISILVIESLPPNPPGHISFMAFVLISLFLLNVYIQIRMGLSYQKIDDFIGLLHPLGILSATLVPLYMIASGILSYPGYWEKMVGKNGLTLLFIGITSLNNIAAVLVIIIFYRAMKYRRMQQ